MTIRSVDDFAAAPEVVEDADTFAGNARKKASELARALSVWVIADDSGLTVDALGGAPGSFRRGTPASPRMTRPTIASCSRRSRILPTTAAARRFAAPWRWLIPPGAIRLEAEGACRGRLTREARGPAGFGYDPLFLIPEYHKTFGELSPLVKHQLSHRARAFAMLRRGLERMISQGDFDSTGLRRCAENGNAPGVFTPGASCESGHFERHGLGRRRSRPCRGLSGTG